MYQLIAKRQLRKSFAAINIGDFDAVVTNFAPDIRFTFAGNHAIGADLTSRESVRRWFDRLHELFPGLKLTIIRITVAGLPWNMMATTEFDVDATLPNGEAYHNHGIQVVNIRFGRVVEDHIIEDTLHLSHALQAIRASGQQMAEATPLRDPM